MPRPPQQQHTIHPTPPNSIFDGAFQETLNTRMMKIEETLEKLYEKMENIFIKIDTLESSHQFDESSSENK
jgi:hypothetical protein